MATNRSKHTTRPIQGRSGGGGQQAGGNRLRGLMGKGSGRKKHKQQSKIVGGQGGKSAK
jgi:hypothetical protein